MITVNVNTPILDLKNDPILKEGSNEELLFKDVTSLALSQHTIKEDTKTDKFNKFKLSIKIMEAGTELELTAEEIVCIKDCVSGIYQSNLILGRIFQILGEK